MKIDISNIIKSSIDAKTKMLNENQEAIQKACELMLNSVMSGNKILWCGNGGSAADSQHMSAELMGGLRSHNRDPIPSIALTTDSSFVTAWSTIQHLIIFFQDRSMELVHLETFLSQFLLAETQQTF